MKKVRQNVFETNSSSTHSVCIAEGSLSDTLPVVDGVVTLETGEFGWEQDEYHDVMSRANYATTYAMEEAFHWSSKEANLESPRLTALVNAVKAHTGADEVKIAEGGDLYKYGYIDHQSHDVADEIFESEETIAQFIFNPDSSFETDNDNH